MKQVEIVVNGAERRAQVEPRLLLVHFLREVCGLTGTHIGCETSLCGACTVMLDGRAVKSCTVLAIQAAFWEEHGLQCGFCTPGMIMCANDVLARSPDPGEEEIREGISGNLCRCTGYQHIVNAVRSASKKMARQRSAAAGAGKR